MRCGKSSVTRLVEFVFLDESLKARTLSGRFRVGDVESLLLSLRVNFNYQT